MSRRTPSRPPRRHSRATTIQPEDLPADAPRDAGLDDAAAAARESIVIDAGTVGVERLPGLDNDRRVEAVGTQALPLWARLWEIQRDVHRTVAAPAPRSDAWRRLEEGHHDALPQVLREAGDSDCHRWSK